MGEEIRTAENHLPDGETKLEHKEEEEQDLEARRSKSWSWTAEGDEEEQDLEARLSKSRSWTAGGDDSDQKEAMQPLLSCPPGPTLPGVESKSERLASLDVFRGLTVAAMILVDYGGGLWSGINHSPWNGVTFADFVVPAFLFIVGVSLTLTYKTQQDRRFATYNVLLRVLKLFGLGLLLQGGYIHSLGDLSYGVDIRLLRIMGVLQRIAVAYGIVALFEAQADKALDKVVRQANSACYPIGCSLKLKEKGKVKMKEQDGGIQDGWPDGLFYILQFQQPLWKKKDGWQQPKEVIALR